MADVTVARQGPVRAGSPLAHLWNRTLDSYPNSGRRYLYLAIVVLATITLYYEQYIAGAVGPNIIADFHISFRYYVNISVVAAIFGAAGSVLAGLGDRWGRANMVAYGLVVTGLLVLVGIPNASSKLAYAVMVVAIGLVEGVVLVATPALVRDYSPQLGRASAMGFWTLGPVVGSLVVAEVSSNTLPHLHAWQDQFIICGVVGIVMAAIAVIGLRELSPNLRDQLMVSIRDRALIEARAKGIDVQEALRHPWRQVLHLDVVSSAFAVSVYLLIYFAAVGFFVIYFSTIFGFSVAQANGIGNWFWAFDAGALIVVGALSDVLRVRKPFMVIGGVGAIVMTIVFLTRASHPHTGYYTFVWMVSVLAVFLAVAYAPWMASFTETVEKHNPALTATGLAVWGWIIRVVVAVSAFVLPYVVSSMSPLVEYGAAVQAVVKQYPAQVATLSVIQPKTLAALTANPANSTAITQAVSQISAGLHVSSGKALQDLIAVSKLPASAKATLTHAPAVVSAAKRTPHQWQTWWWVCVGGEVVFLPLIFLMAGRWSPRKAREDAEAHEREVEAEMAKLAASGTMTAQA